MNREQIADFVIWLKENKYCQYKDGTWYSTNERPYVRGEQRKFYKDEQLIDLYFREKEKI